MNKTHRSLLALLTVLLLLLTACGSDGNDDGSGDGGATTIDGTTDDGSGDRDAEDGSAPQRIVSLSSTTTEMLFAIGAGDQVVAVDKHSDFPDGTPITDLSGFQPNIEAIAGHDPDLVVLARDRDGVVDALEGLGVDTLLLESAEDLDEVYEQIDALGTATGHEDEAADLIGSMRADIDDLVARVPERDEPLTYYYELSADLTTATSSTFIGQVLELAGLTNIADDVDPAAGGYPQLTAEHVVDADPDLVLLAHAEQSDDAVDEVAGRPGWSELQAVRGDGVLILDSDIASRWGPRIVELLRVVIDATEGR